MKKLLIVEDHPILRNGLKALLVELEGFEICAEAGSLGDARQALLEHRPDLVLLDISLPDGTGLELLKERMTSGDSDRSTKFIVLTMHKEGPYITKAKELGAHGFVLKDMAPESLIETIEAVMDNELRFPIEIENEEDSQVLSPRERIVKDMLVQGISLTEIGKQLGLSVKTISTYRTRVLAKLGVANNAELVKKELRENPLS